MTELKITLKAARVNAGLKWLSGWGMREGSVIIITDIYLEKIAAVC